MSATVDRPAATAALARVEGLELLGPVSGSGYKAGAALVRRADGQMVQLGPLTYGLLEEIERERDDQALGDGLSEPLGPRVDPAQIAALGGKLPDQGLVAGSEDNAPPRTNPLLALRWKVLVTDPKVTRRLTGPFLHLFRPWLVAAVLAAFTALLGYVLIHKVVA